MSTLEAKPWSAQQCEWLAALGYDVLVPAPAAPAPDAPGKSLQSEMPGARLQPTAAAGLPLLRALAHAAGRDTTDPEFLQALPDLESLRTDPAARKALWPRLRGLRRQVRG